MADTAQPPASATAAGTTSASPLSTSNAEVLPRAVKTPVLPPQVPHVDPSAVPVPSCTSDPTSSIAYEAVSPNPTAPSALPDQVSQPSGEAKPMENQQTDSQSVALNFKDNQERCPINFKDDSKQTNNVTPPLNVKKKLLNRTNELSPSRTVSPVYNAPEKIVEKLDKTLNPVAKTVGTLQGSPTDSTSTTPCDSQESKSQEKLSSIGEANISNDTNSLKNVESNSVEEISKSKEKESSIHSLKNDDISEKNEKTSENQNNEAQLNENINASEGNVCNNVGLDKSKTDGSEPESTEAMETNLVNDSEDNTSGLLRNMENEVASWAGDAEGDTAMSATTTNDDANINKENITHQMDTHENESLSEKTQASESENIEHRNFSSITQLAAEDEKNKIAAKENSIDQNLESKVNDNSSLNNGPLEIGTENNGPVTAAEAVEGNNEVEDRDVPSLEDIESTLDEVNQSQDIVDDAGCRVNENAIEVATSLKPVTIGSVMQPLEESMEANSIDDSREAFTSETMALIESSADEDSSCVGGLVINSVVGAAEALAQFPPDEEDTEQTGPKELMDISISGPTNEEEGPAAKRPRLENDEDDPGKKLQDSDVKNVLLKVAPIKNGHGLWDAAKLKQILQNKGSILLRLHLSPDLAEANTKDNHNQDLSAIMIEVKDDDHIMGLSHLDSDADYDPLALSIVEHMSPMSQQPGSGRGYSRSPIRSAASGAPMLGGVGRSTSLQPAVPRGPGYQMDNMYDLEFEDPQHSWSNSGMDHPGYQHDQVHHPVYQHDLHHQSYHPGYHYESATPKKLSSIIKTPQKGRQLDIYGNDMRGSYPNPNSSRPLRYPPGSVTARGKKRGRPPMGYRHSFSPPGGRTEEMSPTPPLLPIPLPPQPQSQPPPAKVRKVVPPKPSLKFRAPTPPRNISSIKNTPKPSEIEAMRAKLETRIEEELKETPKPNKEDEGPKSELTCPKLHAFKYMQLGTKVLKNGTVKLVCVFCNTVFRKKTALQGHIRYKHRYMQQCPICKKNLDSKDNKYILRFHILKEHKDVPAYQCEKCPEAFKLEHHLKNHKRLIHKIQEKSEESESTTTTTAAEETEEDEEDSNHISHSDNYEDEIDDDMKENQVEREIQRIKRAREEEIEKTNQRKAEALRILEKFERESKILEREQQRRKELGISGRGRGRGRGTILGSGMHRIGEDLLKVPKKRGPKPKIKSASDDNRLSDSSTGRKKPGPKPGWKQRLLEARLNESSAEDQTDQTEKEEEEESGEREVESERRKGRGRGRGGGIRGRSTPPTATSTTSTSTTARRGRSPQKSKVSEKNILHDNIDSSYSPHKSGRTMHSHHKDAILHDFDESDDDDDDKSISSSVDNLTGPRRKIHGTMSHDEENEDDSDVSDDDSDELEEEPKRYFCNICDEGFSHVFKLRHHRKEQHSRISIATAASDTLPGNRRSQIHDDSDDDGRDDDDDDDDDDEDGDEDDGNLRVRRSTRSARDLKQRLRTSVIQESDDEDEDDESDELKTRVGRRSLGRIRNDDDSDNLSEPTSRVSRTLGKVKNIIRSSGSGQQMQSDDNNDCETSEQPGNKSSITSKNLVKTTKNETTSVKGLIEIEKTTSAQESSSSNITSEKSNVKSESKSDVKSIDESVVKSESKSEVKSIFVPRQVKKDSQDVPRQVKKDSQDVPGQVKKDSEDDDDDDDEQNQPVSKVDIKNLPPYVKRNGNSFLCEKCNIILKRESAVTYHLKKIHETLYPFRACEHCGKIFRSQGPYHRHLQTHRVHNCPEPNCKAKYKKMLKLKQHQKNSHHDKPHRCLKCVMLFKTEKELKDHTEEKHPKVPSSSSSSSSDDEASEPKAAASVSGSESTNEEENNQQVKKESEEKEKESMESLGRRRQARAKVATYAESEEEEDLVPILTKRNIPRIGLGVCGLPKHKRSPTKIRTGPPLVRGVGGKFVSPMTSRSGKQNTVKANVAHTSSGTRTSGRLTDKMEDKNINSSEDENEESSENDVKTVPAPVRGVGGKFVSPKTSQGGKLSSVKGNVANIKSGKRTPGRLTDKSEDRNVISSEEENEDSSENGGVDRKYVSSKTSQGGKLSSVKGNVANIRSGKQTPGRLTEKTEDRNVNSSEEENEDSSENEVKENVSIKDYKNRLSKESHVNIDNRRLRVNVTRVEKSKIVQKEEIKSSIQGERARRGAVRPLSKQKSVAGSSVSPWTAAFQAQLGAKEEEDEDEDEKTEEDEEEEEEEEENKEGKLPGQKPSSPAPNRRKFLVSAAVRGSGRGIYRRALTRSVIAAQGESSTRSRGSNIRSTRTPGIGSSSSMVVDLEEDSLFSIDEPHLNIGQDPQTPSEEISEFVPDD